MKQQLGHLGKRALRALAFASFILCSFIIISGTIISLSAPTNAEPEPAANPAMEATLARAEASAAAWQQRAHQAEEAHRMAMELVGRETTRHSVTLAATVQAQSQAVAKGIADGRRMSSLSQNTGNFATRAVSFLGIFALIGVAWLMSTDRKNISWKPVAMGVVIQLVFAIVILKIPGGQYVFDVATAAISKLLEFTNVGSNFVFESFVTGQWDPGLINFAFSVLPTIIFFSALMTILYHLGVMQKIVYWLALVMQKAMGTSGAETLSATANIFVGQTEAPLVVKPYVDKMTRSELMVVMCGGFATVAGGVMAIYVGMLQSTFPDIAGHLMAASVMGAPAALVISKVIYPETEVPETAGQMEMTTESLDSNVLDAASRGAGEGLTLALNVGAMLLAFLALIAMIDYLLGLPSLMWNKGALGDLIAYYQASGLAIPQGCTIEGVSDTAVTGCIETMRATAGAPDVTVLPMLTLKTIFGYLFWPFAWVMGVPVQDCFLIGQLLGEKMVVNELVAYGSLANMLADPGVELSGRSVIIATYALCGFANFGSIGIQLGGIGGIAPHRKGDLAQIALRAMLGGTLAAFMTGNIAGILI